MAACSLLAAGAIAAAEEPREAHPESPALYAEWGHDPARLPYPKNVDARREIATARERARERHRFVMVTFGANWCPDCRALARQLASDPAKEYADANFEIVKVDIGDFDRNLDVAAALGVDMQMGIPVAVFFDRDGHAIGATNRGELEPSRTYTSRQILAFLHDVVDRGHIGAPASP
jgi:protein disulfide-isomerase